MILKDKTHISFEIKYTELEFGGISPDKNSLGKYQRKFNRNICYVKAGDIVLFLTPRANYSAGLVEGRNYIYSFK